MIRFRFLLPLVIFALLAIVLGIGIKHSPDKGVIASPLIGKPAPQFTAPVLTDANRTFKTSDLKGRWYVFNVWGTWCGGCREEHSALLQIQKSTTVPLIGLDWKDENQTALQYLSELGNPYEVIAVDKEGRTAIDWGVYGAPETFLVSPDGIVVHKYIGPLTMEAWQAEFVPRLPPQRAAKS
jgi:cytochrome c biogenesis protein CcmG, thiol:disulfide interchange protein DsbE